MQPSDRAHSDEAVRRDEERVRREYARRASGIRLRRYYARVVPALARANAERRQRLIVELDRLGERSQLRILDVGCGSGVDLAFLADAGFVESNLAGVDVLPERAGQARALLPSADIRVANGAALPFQDCAFDAALQSVALSSVVDADVRQRVAAEMLRVIRPGGRVFSYDMAVVADRNPHLAAIDRRELARLFGASRVRDVTRLTLWLPVASRAPAWVRRLAERVPQLHTHLLAVIQREED